MFGGDFGGEFGGDYFDFGEGELDQEEEVDESPVNQILATSLESEDFDDRDDGPVNQILDMSLPELPEGGEQEAGELPDSEVEGRGLDAQEGKGPEAEALENEVPEAQEGKAPEAQENEAPEVQEGKAPEVQENKGPEGNEGKEPEALGSRSLSDLPSETLQQYFQDALSHIFDAFGGHIPATIDEIMGRFQIELRNPDQMDGLAGCYTPGRIEVDKTISIDELREVIPHELLHAAGFQPNELEADKDGGFTHNRGSGLDRTQEIQSPDGSVQTMQLGSRGLDEGITEALTQAVLSQMDAELGLTEARTSAYPGTTELCIEAAQLVGQDAFLDAYFGGDIGQLQQSFDQLAGEHGFECFYEALDRTLDKSADVRETGMHECMAILSHMSREVAAREEGDEDA